MPRGVYDRSKMQRHKKPGPKPGSKRKAASAEAAAKPATGRRGRRPKAETATVTQTMSATPRKIVHQDLTPQEQFGIVRENLITLSQVRQQGVKPGESTQTVDAELAQQLQLMGTLRTFHFGHLGEEPEKAQKENGAKSQTAAPVSVPLPPPPQIPVPQIQHSA